MSDLTQEAVLQELLRLAVGFHAPVLVHAELASTSDTAKALAREGAAAGTIVLADAQSHGRGRSGASWHSPAGDNLYFSMVLRLELPPIEVPPLALVVGDAVRECVSARLPVSAAVKWPNDVMVGGRKIAGVLVESLLRGQDLLGLVVGVGINVRTDSFPYELASVATSLRIEGARDLDRSRLAADLAGRVWQAASRYSATRLAPFLASLRGHDWLRGRPITVGQVVGVGAGIDDAGQLLVETEHGLQAVSSGHVVMFPPDEHR